MDHAEPNQDLHYQIVICKQKREQGMTKVEWCNLPLWGLCTLYNFFKKRDFSEARFVSFLGKEAPNLVDPLDRVVFSHWAP